MFSLQTIRQLYKPVQPAIRNYSGNVEYREILPHEKLQSCIYCYWQLKAERKLSEPFTYRVVADGCIDIFFEIDNPVESFVMGFCKKYTEFPLENTFHYIGIRFLPTMFPQFFKMDASLLSNRFLSLNDVIPTTAQFIADTFNSDLNLTKIKSKLDSYFLNLMHTIHFDDDARLYDALAVILKNNGVLNIAADIDTGISQRQLRRIFTYYIGDTVKTFCKVVRFQNILKAKPSVQNLKKNKLFFDAGYYDQAHFIKEFKNFYGITPTQAFDI